MTAGSGRSSPGKAQLVCFGRFRLRARLSLTVAPFTSSGALWEAFGRQWLHREATPAATNATHTTAVHRVSVLPTSSERDALFARSGAAPLGSTRPGHPLLHPSVEQWDSPLAARRASHEAHSGVAVSALPAQRAARRRSGVPRDVSSHPRVRRAHRGLHGDGEVVPRAQRQKKALDIPCEHRWTMVRAAAGGSCVPMTPGQPARSSHGA